MMTDAERIEMIQRAIALLDHAGILLVEATRHHYMASYKANPDALLDNNGDPLEIDIDGLGDRPICVELMAVGRLAREEAAQIQAVVGKKESCDVEVIKRTISKEEAAPLLAKDRAAYQNRQGNTGGVAPSSNVVVPGGKYDNPVVK